MCGMPIIRLRRSYIVQSVRDPILVREEARLLVDADYKTRKELEPITMCNICKDWEMGKLTAKEALNNLWEIAQDVEVEADQQHYQDLTDKLIDEFNKDKNVED